ncbi:MAG: 7,8-didemethyl-8-hydroxy-5-deazariboflavin synthase subunit CofG [Promethearchaeota archaeon]
MFEKLKSIHDAWKSRLPSLEAEFPQSGDVDEFISSLKVITRDGGRIARALDRNRITYSRNYFIPVSRLCRNHCLYCNFKAEGAGAGNRSSRDFLYPLDVLREDLVNAREVGCTEVLFCGGEGADMDARVFRKIKDAGIPSGDIVDWLVEAFRITLKSGLLPHTNVGILSRDELAKLSGLNASMGLMLESSDPGLMARGNVHENSPGKDPGVRLDMMRVAGELNIPFTSGILVGIDKNLVYTVNSLLALRELHLRFNHIQEIIVQGLKDLPRKAIDAGLQEPSKEHLLLVTSLARIIMPASVSIQVPPNLTGLGGICDYVEAGASDLGGVSPVTIDHVNPLAPWPEVEELKNVLKSNGFHLVERLPVHDGFINLLKGEARELAVKLHEKIEKV